jgi:hypothetical protein
MTKDKEARVRLKISDDGAEYQEFLAELIYEDGGPFGVEPDPAHRTAESAKYELVPEDIHRLPSGADGAEVFEYRRVIRLG